MLTSTSPEQPALGPQSPLNKALTKPTVDISPSTPLSRNSPTLERVNRLLSRASRKVTPSTPSTPSIPITPMARLGVASTPRSSRPTPRSPRASRSVEQLAMYRRTSITKSATTPAASTTPASSLDSPRRSQEIHSLCRRIAFKQNVFNLNSRSISNDTMRDFFQDLKERNRVERVRHYQNERKHEREKRWYRLRGIRMPWEIVSQSQARLAKAGPLHLLTELEPSPLGRAPLTRQPTLQDVCLSFKPGEHHDRRGSWHIQAKKARKDEENYRNEKLKWYKNARIALLTDNTSEMLQPGPHAVFVTDLASFSPMNRCNECYSDDCFHQFENAATYRGKFAILARRSANRKAQLKINTRKPSIEFTDWANRGKRWGQLRLQSFLNLGKAARGWEVLKRRRVTTTPTDEKRRSSASIASIDKQSNNSNNDPDLEIDLDQTVLAPNDSTKNRSAKKSNGRISPMDDGTAGNPMDNILVVSPSDSNAICTGAIITIQTIGQVLQNKTLKQLFFMANEAVHHATERNENTTMDVSLASSLEDYLSIDIFCDEAMNIKGVLEYIFLQRYLCINKIVIPDKYQRNGIGSVMMKRIHLLAKWRHKDLLVYAPPKTVPFYVKWGYETRKDIVADDDSVVMVKPVAAPERAESYGFSIGKCNTLLDA
ncbi:hypothetical protein VKS41_009259 [Umbelopsis sp. WA50703]